MMIKNLLLIAVSASLTAIFETVLYTFLAFNTFDKTLDNPLSVPFLVMIAYYFSILLMSLGEWIRCFKHSEYLERKNKLLHLGWCPRPYSCGISSGQQPYPPRLASYLQELLTLCDRRVCNRYYLGPSMETEKESCSLT